jgi:hypothetical protein
MFERSIVRLRMQRKIVEVFLVSFVVFGVAGLYFRFVGGIPFVVSQTSTQKASTFDVSAEGTVDVVPDQASVSLGVRKSAATVKLAQNEANKVLNEMNTELKKLGIDSKDIKTTNYNVNPDFDNTDWRTINGYTVSANISVNIKESNFEKLSEVMDLTGKLGLEQVSGVSFELSEEKRKLALDEARKKAIGEAKQKAEDLAKMAGMRLGKIVNVYESTVGNYPVPMYARSLNVAADMKEANITTPVNPGSNELRMTITLSFETL